MISGSLLLWSRAFHPCRSHTASACPPVPSLCTSWCSQRLHLHGRQHGNTSVQLKNKAISNNNNNLGLTSVPTVGFKHGVERVLKHGTCLVLQIYMYLWAQPPSHQVLMRLCIQLQCLAWQMVLGWIWILPLRLVCLSNVQTHVLLAWLSLLQEPHQGPIHNKTSLAVGWGLQLC